MIGVVLWSPARPLRWDKVCCAELWCRGCFWRRWPGRHGGVPTAAAAEVAAASGAAAGRGRPLGRSLGGCLPGAQRARVSGPVLCAREDRLTALRVLLITVPPSVRRSQPLIAVQHRAMFRCFGVLVASAAYQALLGLAKRLESSIAFYHMSCQVREHQNQRQSSARKAQGRRLVYLLFLAFRTFN